MTAAARVLLVDPDVAFAAAVTRLAVPHRVELAASATSALAAVTAGGFDLLIADAHTWPIDGLALVAELHRRGLALPVLLVTGGDAARVRRRVVDLRLHDVAAVLAMPFTRHALASAIAAALATPSSERITTHALAAALAPLPARPREP